MKSKGLLSFLLVAFLTSCGRNIDGPLKEYVLNFNYTNGMAEIKSGTVVYSIEGYDSYDVMTTKTVSTTTFYTYVKNNLELYFIRTYVEYSLAAIDDGIVSTMSDLRYDSAIGTYINRLYQNGVYQKESTYSSSEVYDSYIGLFYTSDVASMKSGGIYYGDTIVTRLNTLEDAYYKIDEDNNLWIYSTVEDYEGYFHEQYLYVNQYGFLLNFSWLMREIESGKYGYEKYDVTYNNIDSLPSLPSNEV